MVAQKPYTGPARLVLAFDIGTTNSSVSYCILQDGQIPKVHEVTRFPSERESCQDRGRVPSLLYYDQEGSVKAVGDEVFAERVIRNAEKNDWVKARCWKLHLGPKHLISSPIKQGGDIPPLPPGKTAFDVLTDFIKYLFDSAKHYILKARHDGLDWSSVKDSIEFIFTHPNGWESEQRQQYRRAIEEAGLVPSTPEGRSRVRMIAECEASLHYCVSNPIGSQTQGFIVVDAGGGFIDISMYSMTFHPTSCKEAAPAECHLHGSVFTACRANAFLQSKLDELSDSSPEEIAEIKRMFEQTTNLPINIADEPVYSEDKSLICDDSNNNIECGKVKLLGTDISMLFNDVMLSIICAYEQQCRASTTRITKAFIVGRFAMNDWLFTRLKSYFELQGIQICRPDDDINSTVSHGAVLSHIDRGHRLVTSRVPRVTPSESKTSPIFSSAARDRWKEQNHAEGVKNTIIDEIMGMTGLEQVKEQILCIKGMIDTAKRQGVPINKERLNIVLLGNPGTGKTTVARLYAQFLASIDALPGKGFVETTGSKLSFEGVQGAQDLISKVLKDFGGAIFIDEAYQLVSDHDQSGRQVLDYLIAETENRVGTLVFILAGYNQKMEKFFEHNPALPSRFPYQLHFADFTHKELMWMLEDLVYQRYNGWMEVEGGINGLFARIAIRRLVRGSGKPGFGNARAVQNMFATIRGRQAERLERERRLRMQVEDFVLSKEDLIGPDPSTVLRDSEPWRKLRELIGLESVKESVRNFFNLLETNYQRELAEKEPIQVSLNRVFLGSPGTGKTSVAKLYGQILADLGMLSKGEVVVKNPADFVGAHLGQSEKNTKSILDSTLGKVLVIDEAYMLYSKNASNTYMTAVVDTMVSEIQSVPGEDRCVLLLGYKDQMEEMFQNVNPGLARRFAIENAFNFDDFTEPQLMQILEYKLKEQDLSATDEAKRVAGEILGRLKTRPNFGNAGEVENLLGQAKTRQQNRLASMPASQRMDVMFEPQDFDPDFARSENASENLEKMFSDIVGCHEVKEKLDGYQRVALGMKENGLDMLDMRETIPTNFVFKGPPGTGKTMVARKFGQIFYDMGFLASAEVVECSATDLIGQYVGQTGPQTKGVFEKALSKVLFIDEAYRLNGGHFAKEAMDEIVGLTTNERFMNKLVIILAGYDDEMNALLAVNTGLSSRFSEEIIFQSMTPAQCLELLDKELQKKKIDVPDLRNDTSDSYVKMQDIIAQLAALPSWGNGRDVKTLGQKMIRKALTNKKLSLSVGEVFSIMESLLKERQVRQCTTRSPLSLSSAPMATMNSPAPPPYKHSPPPFLTTSPPRSGPDQPRPPALNSQGDMSIEHDVERTPPNTSKKEHPPNRQAVQRDPGVSDAVWNQLQEDRKAQKKSARETAMKRRIEAMGLCPMGYEWIRQQDGYRCAGGSHFISHDKLGIYG